MDTGSGAWLLRGLAVLAGCAPLLVVVGAARDRVRGLLPPGVVAVDNLQHETGMGSSLRAGLLAMPRTVDAALVTLVDLPDVTGDVATRVRAAVGSEAAAVRGALARATFHGEPGHPVLIGRDHWTGVLRGATGDAGARAYMRKHGAVLVECGDLASGEDVDVRPVP